ncbi:ERB1 protein, partial [Pardalotus punctatus]|nr:ERB1 protein [Pardalotus punctatus]
DTMKYKYINSTYYGYNTTSCQGLGALGAENKNSPLTIWNNGTPKALLPSLFLICGDRAWQGIPSSIFGGPCYLGELTFLVPSHRSWLNVLGALRHQCQQHSISHQLGPDCNDELQLWSITARVFSSLFAPGVSAGKALGDIEKLACWTVRQANVTTNIISQMLLNQNSLRHALLQNRAAIDFLLLAQGSGCEDVEGMCCFNLTDHSESARKQLKWLKEHTNKITVEVDPFDKWLSSLFGGLSPWLTSLFKEGLRLLGILLAVVIVIRIAYG